MNDPDPREIAPRLDRLGALLARIETEGTDPAVVGTAQTMLAEIRRDLVGAPELLVIRTLSAAASLDALCGDAAAALAGFDRVVQRSATVTTADDRVVDLVVSALVDAAVLLTRSGELLEAELRLDRAERLGESGVDPRVMLGIASARTGLELRRGRPSTAVRWASSAVQFGRAVPGNGWVAALVNLAQVSAQIGDADRAGQLFAQVLAEADRTAGDDRTARFGLGSLLVQLGRFDQAVPLLIEAAQAAQQAQDLPLFAEAALAVGWAGHSTGQLDVARAWYDTAASAAPDPATTAASAALIAATWTSHDPRAAARWRELARERAGAASAETRVAIDCFTALDALRAGDSAALDLLVPAALVMDRWRIDLPWGLAREVWRRTTRAHITGLVLEVAHRAGRHDLAVAVAAHLTATLPPDSGSDALPPRVLIGGTDPLGEIAAAALDRYGCPIRDDARPVEAFPAEPGTLDLIALRRGDLFLCWLAPDRTPRSVGVPAPECDEPIAAFVLATDAAASSALADRDQEAALMRHLGRVLLPAELVADLGTLPVDGLLRVRAEEDLAVLSWGLLALPGPGDRRVLERVHVATRAPFGAGTDRADPGSGGLVAVLDPRVPGAARDSALGSVLGGDGGPLVARLQDRAGSGQPVAGLGSGRTDQDRDWLGTALAGRPSRLLYLGHAGPARTVDGRHTEPALHLCCAADAPGRAAPVGTHRPWTAGDLLDTVPLSPPRVALIACASGDDARIRDAFGLAHALLSRGADLVTALRWSLPTGQWYRDTGADFPLERNPVVELTLAVDDAQESDDPVRRLGDWQRERLRRWRDGGGLLDSPLGWGGVHTIV